jgi:hypothetical protein
LQQGSFQKITMFFDTDVPQLGIVISYFHPAKGRQPKLLPQSKGYPQRLASWTELTHKAFTQADQ